MIRIIRRKGLDIALWLVIKIINKSEQSFGFQLLCCIFNMYWSCWIFLWCMRLETAWLFWAEVSYILHVVTFGCRRRLYQIVYIIDKIFLSIHQWILKNKLLTFFSFEITDFYVAPCSVLWSKQMIGHVRHTLFYVTTLKFTCLVFQTNLWVFPDFQVKGCTTQGYLNIVQIVAGFLILGSKKKKKFITPDIIIECII